MVPAMRRKDTATFTPSARCLALALALAPAAGGAGEFQFCEGTYAASWGKVALSGGGITVPAGTPGRTEVTLTRQGCDRVVISAEGQSIDTLRQGPNHWRGTLVRPEVTVTYDFHLSSPAEATAAMRAAGGGAMAQRGVQIVLSSPAAEQDFSCLAEEETAQGPALPEKEAGIAWARQAGLVPAEGFDYSDYVHASRAYVPALNPSRDRVARSVSLHLSAEGEVLPVADIRMLHEAYCAPGTFVDPPRTMLDFKILDVPPGTTVFARTVDIETGRITAQAEGQADGTGPAAIAAAMADAQANLGFAPGEMSDGMIRR